MDARSGKLGVAVDWAVMCHSEFILRDVQRAVENAQHIDVSIVLHEASDPVMPIEQDSDVPPRSKVAVSNFGMTGENLRARS
jgi:hypothetical protein